MSPTFPGCLAHVDQRGPQSHPPVRRVRRRIGRLLAALALPAALALLSTSLVAAPAAAVLPSAAVNSVHRVTTVELALPAGMDPSEPHLAVDPRNPARLFAVVQATSPDNPFGQELLWRTADRGRTWLRSPVLGGVDNSAQGSSGDPWWRRRAGGGSCSEP
jgi:hypothetical protein